jgi:hypothetical protein
MARFVVQPNGLLALYSAVAEDFVLYNATDDEAVEMFVEEGREAAIRRVESARKDATDPTIGAPRLPPHPESLNRWHEAFLAIERQHGGKRAAARALEYRTMWAPNEPMTEEDRIDVAMMCDAERFPEHDKLASAEDDREVAMKFGAFLLETLTRVGALTHQPPPEGALERLADAWLEIDRAKLGVEREAALAKVRAEERESMR